MRSGIILLIVLLSTSSVRAANQVPDLLLAETYHADIKLSDYLVSEKYDGVRAYWNGSVLLTRRGNIIKTPDWFTAPLPEHTSLDGELWMGRNRFDALSAAVRRQQPDDTEWQSIRYMLFDLPALDAPFSERARRLQHLTRDMGTAHVQMVEQIEVTRHDHLMRLMQQVVSDGGEGLMLHRASSLYRGGRSDDLIKLKPYDDAEAVVLQHLPGQGRLTGMMGSLLLQTPDGRRFRLGSGFSDAQRQNPPAIGATITYRYRGLTSTGLPRFASFVRERPDL